MALILLDAGLVGLAISTPRGKDSQQETSGQVFRDWLIATGMTVHEFAIADVTLYEVERELLRVGATAKLRRLDRLSDQTTPLAVTPDVWRRAAKLWAITRQQGKPTASADSLDGDAILSAVALTLLEEGQAVFIATTNVRHIKWFGVPIFDWQDA